MWSVLKKSLEGRNWVEEAQLTWDKPRREPVFLPLWMHLKVDWAIKCAWGNRMREYIYFAPVSFFLKFWGRFWLVLACRHHLLLTLVISLNPVSPPSAASLCQSIVNLTLSIPLLYLLQKGQLYGLLPTRSFLKKYSHDFCPFRVSSHLAAVKSNQGGKQSQFCSFPQDYCWFTSVKATTLSS